MTSLDLDRIEEERRRIADTYLTKAGGPSSARGIHHVALISSDVERTVRFYQELLEFPMLEIFENRDYRGSNHFFFNVGNGNAIAFFDFPGLDLGPYAEVLGGLHHVAISMEPEKWRRIKDKLDEAGIDYMLESEVSLYFSDPDGVRLELIADPLGEMYGNVLLGE